MPVTKKVVRQASGVYTVTLPEDIVEAKGWDDAVLRVEIRGDKIILTKVKQG